MWVADEYGIDSERLSVGMNPERDGSHHLAHLLGTTESEDFCKKGATASGFGGPW